MARDRMVLLPFGRFAISVLPAAFVRFLLCFFNALGAAAVLNWVCNGLLGLAFPPMQAAGPSCLACVAARVYEHRQKENSSYISRQLRVDRVLVLSIGSTSTKCGCRFSGGPWSGRVRSLLRRPGDLARHHPALRPGDQGQARTSTMRTHKHDAHAHAHAIARSTAPHARTHGHART
eukprot:4294381-Pleurochrysis_carterae.AAC.3